MVTGVAMTAARRAAPRRPGDGHAWPTAGVIEADEILVAVGRRPATATSAWSTFGLTPGLSGRGRRLAARGRRRRRLAVRGRRLQRPGPAHPHGQVPGPDRRRRRSWARKRHDVARRDNVPRVTFTDPQVCAVGLTEAQAASRGLRGHAWSHRDRRAWPAPTRRATASRAPASWWSTRTAGLIVGATFTGPGIARAAALRDGRDRRRGDRSTGCGTRSRPSRP